MRQTLFLIPHELLGVPLFGLGWAFFAWLILAAIMLFVLWRRQGWNADTLSYGLVLAVIGAAILFLLPNLEARRMDGEPLGLPVRGYGVFMLAGVVSGVLLAAHRAHRMGLDPDIIYSLAFWMFLSGIAGARLFYVVQYWGDFQRETVMATVSQVLKFTEGGLVVYGSVIGALAAAFVFFVRRRLPVLAMADLIAPSLLVGAFLGRLGCLMNGCCFGGVCEDGVAIAFPFNSPPYVHQLQSGELVGVRVEKDEKSKLQGRVAKVRSSSEAAKLGLKEGDPIYLRPISNQSLQRAVEQEDLERQALTLQSGDIRRSWKISELPQQSKPVYPAQIYSSINAALLCLALLAWYPYRRRDGELFLALWIMYPVTRILLEVIRSDEPGRFGTALTISQWVSVLILISAAAGWLWLLRQPKGSALPLTGKA